MAVAESILNVGAIRKDFPILSLTVHGKPLAYLDNAATAQKPQVVLKAIRRYYETENANIHRGVHTLSQLATQEYESTRKTVQRFLGARRKEEIVFVRGTTEGINLVAASWGRANLHAGDEIVLTGMEHHSNIVPWQLVAEQTGTIIRVAPITDSGELVLAELEKLIGPRTKMVSVVHLSNALGTINPVAEIVQMAHAVGAKVLVDAAQSAPHLALDVQELGVDFLAFSGHKVYGPTGIGVLYGRYELLKSMPPYQGGGDMIRRVTFAKTDFADPPARFEAGTPNIAGVVGLKAAVEYVQSVGLTAIGSHEDDLTRYAMDRLARVPGVHLVGTAAKKCGVVSFVMQDVHPHDIGTVLDMEGIAIRAGHHCTQPLMDRLGLTATARASFAMYNTREEVDALAEALLKVKEVLGV